MTGLAHPLADVLGALVESSVAPERPAAQRGDSGWTWMFVLVTAIGILAIATR